MPEYTYNGQSTYYATTCQECSAGCGLVVRTMQGRAIKVEGNKSHPVNLGKTCARGQVTLQGLYNPDRIQNPGRHTRGANRWSSSAGTGFQEITWLDAVTVVEEAENNRPDEIASWSVWPRITYSSGGAGDRCADYCDLVPRMFEARQTLVKAAERMLGTAGLPFFDIGGADVVFSFGANFLETWLSPVAQTREFAKFRQRNPRGRGHLVQFEARMSQTASKADEWFGIRRATRCVVLALGCWWPEARASAAPAFANANVESITTADLAWRCWSTCRLCGCRRALAIPGGSALISNGLDLPGRCLR
jgi:anaerobic selenocysteine-containing dehydrogenase